jgi:hypothetical protein
MYVLLGGKQRVSGCTVGCQHWRVVRGESEKLTRLALTQVCLHSPYCMLAGDSYPARFERESARCQCLGWAALR